MERWLSWSKAHDWKSCRAHKALKGSNPFLSATKSYIQFGCSFFVLQFYMLSVRPFLWHNKATKGAELMPEIIPIRDLKNTNAISQRCHETQEPIFVTKSGYGIWLS